MSCDDSKWELIRLSRLNKERAEKRKVYIDKGLPIPDELKWDLVPGVEMVNDRYGFGLVPENI